MIRYLLILFILVTLVGCKRPPPPGPAYEERFLVEYDTSDLSELIWDYTTNLKHDKSLFLEDCMVCSGPEHSKIRLQFVTQSILEMCEARDLLVDVVEGLLDRIKSNHVKFHLRPDPFTADQLEVYINCESFFGEYVDPFYVGWIVLEEGMAYYYAFTLKNPELDEWNTRIEPYEKSRTFVKYERQAEAKYKQAHPKPKSVFEERIKKLEEETVFIPTTTAP